MEAECVTLDRLRQTTKQISPELAVARCFDRPEYQVGLIRFAPEAAADAKMIVHEDLDVVCLVVSGHGTLTSDGESTAIGPGSIFRIPARTPHDFAAQGEPLELLYATIKTIGPGDTSRAGDGE